MYWLAALPELLTAAGLLAAWLDPQRLGQRLVEAAVLTLLLEFFVAAGGGFYMLIQNGKGSRARRSLQMMGLAGYIVIVMVVSIWSLHAWWMIGAFCWLTLGKLVTLWRGRRPLAGDELGPALLGFFGGLLLYMLAVFCGALIPWPALGLKPELAEAYGVTHYSDWLGAEPQGALAGGILYFTAVGCLRAVVARWHQRWVKQTA